MPTTPQGDGNSAPPAATNTTQPPATVTVTWDGDQRFGAGRPDRETIHLDGRGATGPSPVDALLGSIAACAGIDVAEILAKRRTPASSMRIEAIGERVTTIPKRLKHVTLHFQIEGAGIDRENAERAIELSINKYCSVRSSLREDVPVEWTLEMVTSD
ncbi:MAG: OsmC family protein [Gemmatimonadaceae bacterium]